MIKKIIIFLVLFCAQGYSQAVSAQNDTVVVNANVTGGSIDSIQFYGAINSEAKAYLLSTAIFPIVDLEIPFPQDKNDTLYF